MKNKITNLKNVILAGAFFLALNAFGQSSGAPEKMSYQAVVRNTTNNLVTNQAVGMRVSILQGSITGTAVFTETQTPTTNVNGLVSFEIGGGNPVTGTFAAIDWANAPYFVKTETDPTGGSNYTIAGVSQLLSTPYALYAKTSGSSTPGPQGLQGIAGPQGPAGMNGLDGPTGPMGPQGPAGPMGEPGMAGPQGPMGMNGFDGATGPMGPQGPAGMNGLDGAAGPMGPQGPMGSIGLTGATGATGSQGPAGINGLDGAVGPMGPQGSIGLTGATGPVGPQGATGATGATGPQGIQGIQGIQGLTGATGSQGLAGVAGIGYGGTSNSAKTISLGSKTFAVQAGLAYIPGERIRFVDQTNMVNFLEGTITSYANTTMVVNIDNNGGTGTVFNWNLSVGGNLGTNGTNGVGVPTGGAAGQVLSKVDGSDYNTTWVTPAGADNLGNHTSTTTLNMNSNAITGATNITATGTATLGGNAYPTTTGSAGQVLTSNGAGTLSWGSSSGGGATLILRVTSTVAQSFSFGSSITAPDVASTCFNNEITDVGNTFSNGIFTAPSTGLYLVSIQAVTTSTSFLTPVIDVNNNGIDGTDFVGTGVFMNTTSQSVAKGRGQLQSTVFLTAGQTFSIRMNNGTSVVTLSNSTDGTTNITVVKLL